MRRPIKYNNRFWCPSLRLRLLKVNRHVISLVQQLIPLIVT